MVIILIALAVVLGIAYSQVVQGLFSALIMTILSIVSAAFAFIYCEPLAELLYKTQPAYADGAALIVLFVLSLLGLRLLYDRFLSANVTLGVWADRIGGGVLGLITGMLLVGMLMIAAQMLPFGQTVLGYRPFDDSLQRDQSLMPFRPDQFTLGVMEGLSAGALKEDRRLGEIHQDLLLEGFCARNTAGKAGRVDALTDSLKIVSVFEPPTENTFTSWMNELPPDAILGRDATTKVVVVRVTVGDSARGDDDWWRLSATHFRLVTIKAEKMVPSSAPAGRSCYPVAYLLYRGGKWDPIVPPKEGTAVQYAKLIVERSSTGNANQLTIDWVYRIPLDEKPDYLVFRRVAKAEAKTATKSNPTSSGAMQEVKRAPGRPRGRGSRRRR